MQIHAQPHTLAGVDCRERRARLGLSRSELARQALVDVATIYRFETGAPVADITRRRISAALERAEGEAA